MSEDCSTVLILRYVNEPLGHQAIKSGMYYHIGHSRYHVNITAMR